VKFVGVPFSILPSLHVLFLNFSASRRLCGEKNSPRPALSQRADRLAPRLLADQTLKTGGALPVVTVRAASRLRFDPLELI